MILMDLGGSGTGALRPRRERFGGRSSRAGSRERHTGVRAETVESKSGSRSARWTVREGVGNPRRWR